jgi:hypothetical protein
MNVKVAAAGGGAALVGAGALGWDGRLGAAVVGGVVILAVMGILTNIQIEWVDEARSGRRHRELRITRRSRPRQRASRTDKTTKR